MARTERDRTDDDGVVEAIGKASEALEYVERARGHLYSFHQLMGRADLEFGNAADLLDSCHLDDAATELRDEVIGRNVLDGRWTFQIVEEFDDLYHAVVVAHVRSLKRAHLGGRRHVFESRMKERRRTQGRPGHESRPPSAHTPEVDLTGDR